VENHAENNARVSALHYGSPAFFYIGPRINFTLDPKAKEPLLALFFKSNNQCSSSLTALIQK
jgi:hypothetical protein